LLRRTAELAAVSDEEKIKYMVDEAIKTFGKIEILVNNSGIGGRTCNVVDMKLKERNQHAQQIVFPCPRERSEL
jgi:NAD(P)-dependent dehydrogenase (short-subunit alcohol dehydrogenase family)